MNRKQRRTAGATGATGVGGSVGSGAAFVQAFDAGLQFHQKGEVEKAIVSYRKA